MKTDLTKLTEQCTWTELTEGTQIYEGGTSVAFKTGEWSTIKPQYYIDRCRQCLLCVPTCPDSSIPVSNYKRLNFDYDHCKGCGICAKACPFGAIVMKEEN